MNTLLFRNMQLQAIDIQFIEPAYGELACGTSGKGRMEEPENIVDFLEEALFLTMKILVRRGRHERIDSVRFISNYSTGKMGFALAEVLRVTRYNVVLIAGPTTTNRSFNVKRIDVESAQDVPP